MFYNKNFDLFPYKNYNLTLIQIGNVTNNKPLLKTHGYKKAGIYCWLTHDKMYVGRSINLYSRVRSYSHSTPRNKGIRLIRRYLNKYGLESMRLILFVLPDQYTFNQLVYTEQAFLDYFKPNLNIDKKATSSRYNSVMSNQTYKNFIAKRSHCIDVWDATSGQLLWSFDSKTHCTNKMRIHHTTLNKCIAKNAIYLESFIFSSSDYYNNKHTIIKDINHFLSLVQQKRKQFQLYKLRNKKIQKIYAQNIQNHELSTLFESQRDCAKYLKADRSTLRKYIKNPAKGLFRKVWKFLILM